MRLGEWRETARMTAAATWLIRSGEESRHAREFALHGVVAIGWPAVSGLGDLGGLDREMILEILRASGVKTPDADVNELLAFRDDVLVGDFVVTPDATTRELLVGEIIGVYEYRDPSPAGDYHHVRATKWLRRWPRDQAPSRLLDELRYRRTIRRLTHQSEWHDIVERLRAGEGRPPDAVGKVRPSTTRQTKSQAEHILTRLCPGCGLRRAASQFAPDSELCVDCR
jgi:predicted Mrr-cat superfamily restriction endonuclease